jgi:hypothetical protein
MRQQLATALIALIALTSTPATAQSGSEVRVSPQEWRRLNVFFSNFVEASVQPFRRGEVPPATLVQFGVLHILINAPQRVQREPGRPDYGRLSASDVTAEVTKYFGVPFSRHQSLGGAYSWIQYANGYYVFPRADGETYPFAQLNRLIDLGGGEFTATFSVYQMADYDVDRYGTPVEQLRRSGYEVERLSEMRGRIRRVRESGRDRYVLLEYLPMQ